MLKSDPSQFDFFQLDINRLDEEWLNQPRLYHTHALRLADAKAEFEQAKARRDVVAAELDRDIRLTPSDFHIEGKITEALVQNTILLQKRYQTANDLVIKAKHDVDVLAAVVDALEHRKKSLESLVQLEARDYFATPRAPIGAVGRQVKERKADKAFGARRNSNND